MGVVQNATYFIIPSIWNAQNRPVHKKSRPVIARGWGEKNEKWLLMNIDFFVGNENVLELVVLVAQFSDMWII